MGTALPRDPLCPPFPRIVYTRTPSMGDGHARSGQRECHSECVTASEIHRGKRFRSRRARRAGVAFVGTRAKIRVIKLRSRTLSPRVSEQAISLIYSDAMHSPGAPVFAW